MKIAIPIWNGAVSSVFDFSRSLLLVDVKNDTESGRLEMPLPAQSVPEKANQLRTLGVDLLICGAISRPLASLIASSGIGVLPYVAGQVDEILEAYLSDKLLQPKYALPGSWPGARRGLRRRRRTRRSRH